MTDLLYAEGETYVEIALTGNQRAQVDFLADVDAGWSCYSGGWGSGKTWAGARKFLALHLMNECPGLVVAPTYSALWLLCVPEIERVCGEWGLDYQLFPNGHGKDKAPHAMLEGQPIWLFSAEEPRAIAGFEVGHIWGDEAARWPANRSDPLRSALLQVRGRLRHKAAKVLHGLLTTTPEGTETPIERDFADPATRRRDHRLYVGTTRANNALPTQYFQDLMGAIPAELIDQYLDGKAVSYIANRAHPTFTQAANVDSSLAWNDVLPLHIGADYNVAPMCWHAAYWHMDEYRIIDELVLPDFGQVDAAMHEATRRGWGGRVGPDGRVTQPRMVVFHPDKSAKARSTVGDSEFVAMTQRARALGWNYGGNAAGVNPPVDARINLVSRLVRDATGRASLKVHPRCVWTIEDFERTGRGSSGYDPGTEGRRGHMLDGIGYSVWDVAQPLGPVTATRIPA